MNQKAHEQVSVVEDAVFTEFYERLVPQLLHLLLDMAQHDRQWRASFEKALRVQGLCKGSDPKKVWQPNSMVRSRFVADCSSNGALSLLGRTCPPIAALLKPGKRIGVADVRKLIDRHGAAIAFLAVTEAGQLGLLKSRRALDVAADAIAAHFDGVPSEAAGHDAASASPTQPAQAAEPDRKTEQDEIRRLRQEAKRRDREIQAAKHQIASLTRKNQELEQRLAEQKERLRAAAEHEAASRAALARNESELKRLKQRVEELEKAKRTLEQRLEDERRSWCEERDAQMSRLAAAVETVKAADARAEALERRAAEERQRREDVEALVDETGLTHLLEGLGELERVIASLEQFRAGIAAYQERLAAEEQQRRSEEEELRRRRAEAEEARRKQSEIEAAWLEREGERLANLERTVFGQPIPEMVIIDGHNAILRTYGPESERVERPRFVESMRVMAGRFAELGSNSRIVVCFDTHGSDTEMVESPNLVIRYCDSSNGGADAMIRTLVEAMHPSARCLVVSTDRKHVWRDALRTRYERDSRVAIMDVEPLFDYLAVLERCFQQGAELPRSDKPTISG